MKFYIFKWTLASRKWLFSFSYRNSKRGLLCQRRQQNPSWL